MKFNIDNLSNCKNITECARLLGYNYYNGNVKKKLVAACDKIGFDLWSHLESINKSIKRFCLNCGTSLKRGQYKFCSRSYAASKYSFSIISMYSINLYSNR